MPTPRTRSRRSSSTSGEVPDAIERRVASEPTFVAMIARRRLIDRRRKRQRTVETATMSPELDPPTAATGTAAVEFREEAQRWPENNLSRYVPTNEK